MLNSSSRSDHGSPGLTVPSGPSKASVNSGFPPPRWYTVSATAGSGGQPSMPSSCPATSSPDSPGLDPHHPVHAAQLADQPPQRWDAAQLLGAEGDHEQDWSVLQGTDQERQKVGRGPVSPVHIFDDQHQWPLSGKLLQQEQQRPEQPAPRRLRVTAGGRAAELRQQPGQLCLTVAGQ